MHHTDTGRLNASQWRLAIGVKVLEQLPVERLPHLGAPAGRAYLALNATPMAPSSAELEGSSYDPSRSPATTYFPPMRMGELLPDNYARMCTRSRSTTSPAGDDAHLVEDFAEDDDPFHYDETLEEPGGWEVHLESGRYLAVMIAFTLAAILGSRS